MRISDVILARALHVKCSFLYDSSWSADTINSHFLIILLSVVIEGLKDLVKDFTKSADVLKTRV